MAPERGVAVLLGTNDLIRYTALPALLRKSREEFLDIMVYCSTV